MRAFAAELIGTFALVFIGAGAACADALTGGRIGPTGTALASGLILASVIQSLGAVSGGHFNPVITVAQFSLGRLDAIKAVFYLVSQLLGSALSALCLQAVLHSQPQLLESAPYLGGMFLAGSVGYKAGTLIEAVGTFFLATSYAAAGAMRGGGILSALSIGITWTAAILATGPLTGAALNPARAFGPSVVTGYWANGFVYWIGPLAGGITAYWFYELLHPEKKK
ncbi:MAG: aquaporin [Elusimicrobia bacterium]|nr:aquaporin [Elusimicrobiota bacterium]